MGSPLFAHRGGDAYTVGGHCVTNVSVMHWIAQKQFRSTVIHDLVALKRSTLQSFSRFTLPQSIMSTGQSSLSKGSRTISVAQQLSKIFCTLKNTEKQLKTLCLHSADDLLTGRYIDLKKSPSSVKSENTRVLNRSFAGFTKLPSGRMKQSVSQSKQSSSRCVS